MLDQVLLKIIIFFILDFSKMLIIYKLLIS
jgi:hypothetical protein